MRLQYSNEYNQLLGVIKKARIDGGLTQLEVAKKLNKPQSYVSKIENGERRIDAIELKYLIKILNINATDILN